MNSFCINIQNFIEAMEELDFFIEIVDSDCVYLYASPACVEFSDENEHTIVGKHVSDVLTYADEGGPYFIRSVRERVKSYKSVPTTFINKDKKLYTIFDEIPITLNNGTKGMLSISKFYSSQKDVRQYIKSLEDSFIFEAPKSIKKDLVSFEDIISRDPNILNTIEQCKKIAASDAKVLIIGDTGTGKELIAESLHNASVRKNKPFIAVNCSAMPEGLFESTFFGSVKGAYTDAVKRKGLFEEANGGTLFLDELNSLGKACQAKLLRALETKSVRPLGSNDEVHFDCRIIAAMNCDPLKAIEHKELRSDLFYRLSGNVVKLPPLYERRNDIILLANRFLLSLAKAGGKHLKTLDEKVVKMFYGYSWPGNVRELKNVIEHGVNVAEFCEEVLLLKHLPYYLSYQTEHDSEYFQYNSLMNIEYKEAKKILVNQFEHDYVKNAIKKADGNISAAARNLKLSRQSLYQILKKLNINLDSL